MRQRRVGVSFNSQQFEIKVVPGTPNFLPKRIDISGDTEIWTTAWIHKKAQPMKILNHRYLIEGETTYRYLRIDYDILSSARTYQNLWEEWMVAKGWNCKLANFNKIHSVKWKCEMWIEFKLPSVNEVNRVNSIVKSLHKNWNDNSNSWFISYTFVILIS